MSNVSRLLFDDPPIVISPRLAALVGLNEAIILQQLHYWIQQSSHERDGRRWVYNSYEEWGKQFPFWSQITIRRTIKNLEQMGIVIAKNFNKSGFDRTKWYTIDYEALERLAQGASRGSDQIDVIKLIRSTDQVDQMDPISLIRPIPEINTEITTETIMKPDAGALPRVSIVGDDSSPSSPPFPQKLPLLKDPPLKGRSRSKDPRLSHPAVRAWAEATDTKPWRLNKRQRELIVANVPEDDAETWAQAVRHWLEHGWNPVNVKGQIEFYKRGGAENCDLCAKKGGKHERANGKRRAFVPAKDDPAWVDNEENRRLAIQAGLMDESGRVLIELG